MRTVLATLLGLGLGLGIAWSSAGCTEPRSARCKAVCSKEAECREHATVRETDTAFEEGACVAACAALERDREGTAVVERQADCVERAGADCAALLACS